MYLFMDNKNMIKNKKQKKLYLLGLIGYIIKRLLDSNDKHIQYILSIRMTRKMDFPKNYVNR